MSYKMTIHMKHAKESRFDKTFERRAGRMIDLVMRTTVKVDFGDKDLGFFIQNANATNIPIGFLKFNDKVWTGKEIAQFAKYIDISSEFGVTVTYLDPEPVTIPT
jgi:3-hydroxyisobutyrate dehydrogenase-like beta-hydroxyacid dehydrogenase